MQAEYSNKLSQPTLDLLHSIESETGHEVLVDVEERKDGNTILSCTEENLRIRTPKADYFPDGGVFHELMHLHRLRVEGVFFILPNDDYPGYNETLARSLRNLDNSLEHLHIVPKEVELFPERRAHWEQKIWKEGDLNQLADEDKRRWSLVCAASAKYIFPDSPVCQTTSLAIEKLGLVEKFKAFYDDVLKTMHDKNALVYTVFAHLDLLTDIATLKSYGKPGVGSMTIDIYPTYEADDGPLSEEQVQTIRALAAPQLPQGKTIKRTSLF